MISAFVLLLGLWAIEPRAAILPRVPVIFRPNDDQGNRRSRRRAAKLARQRNSVKD